ncbi:hypothetical protein [Fredinandcohnia sp. 179-A 10B2 NHS]|uniref:hypothetical protein n=1 Tax=Fredinandcohnia sp. 179-A 10B2 NHS TaxID=3235176 RepID=UPI0039A3064F
MNIIEMLDKKLEEAKKRKSDADLLLVSTELLFHLYYEDKMNREELIEMATEIYNLANPNEPLPNLAS